MCVCVCVCVCVRNACMCLDWGVVQRSHGGELRTSPTNWKTLIHLATARVRDRGGSVPLSRHTWRTSDFTCVHTCAQMRAVGTMGSGGRESDVSTCACTSFLLGQKGQRNKHTIEKCKRKYHLKKKQQRKHRKKRPVQKGTCKKGQRTAPKFSEAPLT